MDALLMPCRSNMADMSLATCQQQPTKHSELSLLTLTTYPLTGCTLPGLQTSRCFEWNKAELVGCRMCSALYATCHP